MKSKQTDTILQPTPTTKRDQGAGHSHSARFGFLARVRTKPQRDDPVSAVNFQFTIAGTQTRQFNAASAASPDKTYNPSSSLEKNKHATYWARWSDVSIAFARLRSMSICETISSARKKARKSEVGEEPAATERHIPHSWMMRTIQMKRQQRS